MRLRHTLSCVALFFAITSSSHSQNVIGPSPSELRIRVVSEGEQPFQTPLNVQLLSAAGTPIQESISNDRGEVVFSNLQQGEYRVRVSGKGVRETFADTFAYGSATQTVRVPTVSYAAPGALGYVSARQLTIPDKARREFEKGASALKENNLGTARKHLEKAIQMSPEYAAALNDLGVVSAREDRYEDSLAYFSRAVAADDTHLQSLINLAKTHMMANQMSPAIPWLKKATQLDPTNAEVFKLLGVAQLQTGAFDDALASARKVHQLPHEKLGICHFIAAKALVRQGNNAEAIREYELFLKESPDSPTAKHVKEELARLR